MMSEEPRSHVTNGGSGKHGTASTDQREVLLAAAAGLQRSVESLAEKLDKADAFADETRKIAERSEATAVKTGEVSTSVSKLVKSLLAVVIVLAFAVVGIIVNTARANHANSKADVIQDYQVNNCISANESRRQSAELWNFVLDLSVKGSKAPLTTQGKAIVAAYKAKVAATYAQRDCSKVEKGLVK